MHHTPTCLPPSNAPATSTPDTRHAATAHLLLIIAPPCPPFLWQLFNLGKNVRLFFATYTLAQIRDCAGQIERFFLALPSPSHRDEAPDPAGRQRRHGRRGASPRLRAARRAAAVATETARQAALAALASLYHGIGDVAKVPVDQRRTRSLCLSPPSLFYVHMTSTALIASLLHFTSFTDGQRGPAQRGRRPLRHRAPGTRSLGSGPRGRPAAHDACGDHGQPRD